MSGTTIDARLIKRVRMHPRKLTATHEGMREFLDDTIVPEHHVYHLFEDVWITTDPQHRGPGLSYYIIHRHGSWFKATIPASCIS